MPEGLHSSKISLINSFKKKFESSTLKLFELITLIISLNSVGYAFAATEIIQSAPFLKASIIVKSSPERITKSECVFVLK